MINISEHGFIRCENKKFVDKNNNEIFLKGFGIGGWLVPEGYMLHSKAPSPTTIYQAIIDLIGLKDTKEFFKRYYENYFNELDFSILSKLDINHLRIPFNYRMLMTDKGRFKEEGLKVFDDLIILSKKYGLYLILDMHCAPGSQNGQNISDDLSGNPRLYTERNKYEKLCIKLWCEIARRYKDEECIIGYDLINEPVLSNGATKEMLRDSFVNISKAIRKIDNKHILFIEGDHYATDFENLTPAWDSNMSYSFHKYWNKNDIETIKDRSIDLRDETNLPIWMGESGENNNEWIYDMVDLLESNNISWNFWTHKKMGNTTALYNAKLTQGYKYIIDYWFGKNPKPSKRMAKKWLFEQLEMLKIENCEHFKDLEHALFHKNEVEKYDENVDVIYAPNYDISRRGISHDKHSVSFPGRFNGDRNIGGVYRNDLMSIFESNSIHSNGYKLMLDENSFVSYTLGQKVNKIEIYYNGNATLEIINESFKKTIKLQSMKDKSLVIDNLDFKKDSILKIACVEGSTILYSYKIS